MIGPPGLKLTESLSKVPEFLDNQTKYTILDVGEVIIKSKKELSPQSQSDLENCLVIED